MKRISMYLAFFCFSFIIHAQEKDCIKIDDSFYLVEIDIRKPDSYPIIMLGLSKEMDFNEFSLEDSESFLNSFFTYFFYMSDVDTNNSELIIECLNSKDKEYYNKKYVSKKLEILNKIDQNSINKKIKLIDNSIVYMQICKIKGSFLKIKKYSNKILLNSNEFDIQDIESIKDVFIPIDLPYICKVTYLK
ncbi:hypothetical protein ACKUSY_06175 [Myroides odoratus]